MVDATRVTIVVDGVDLTSWGGPIAKIDLSVLVLDAEPDQAPQVSYLSQFGAAYTIQVEGHNYESAGFIQFWLSPGTSSTGLVMTIPFPGQVFPHYSLNTQISGLELHLQSSQGPMLISENPADLLPDFATHIDQSRFFYRIGGWAAGSGSFQEYGSPLASFSGDVERVAGSVPEPPAIALAVAALLIAQSFSVRARSSGKKTDAPEG